MAAWEGSGYVSLVPALMTQTLGNRKQEPVDPHSSPRTWHGWWSQEMRCTLQADTLESTDALGTDIAVLPCATRQVRHEVDFNVSNEARGPLAGCGGCGDAAMNRPRYHHRPQFHHMLLTPHRRRVGWCLARRFEIRDSPPLTRGKRSIGSHSSRLRTPPSPPRHRLRRAT